MLNILALNRKGGVEQDYQDRSIICYKFQKWSKSPLEQKKMMIIIFENDKDDDDDDPVRWQPGHNGSPYPAPPTPAQCLLCKIKTIPLCICARCTVYTNHCKLYLYVYLCICGRSTPTTVSCTSPTLRYAALSSSPLH